MEILSLHYHLHHSPHPPNSAVVVVVVVSASSSHSLCVVFGRAQQACGPEGWEKLQVVVAAAFLHHHLHHIVVAVDPVAVAEEGVDLESASDAAAIYLSLVEAYLSPIVANGLIHIAVSVAIYLILFLGSSQFSAAVSAGVDEPHVRRRRSVRAAVVERERLS